MSNEIKEKIQKLRESIKYHNKLYYQDQQPEIEDFEYDQLYEELKNLEQQYPQYDDLKSPTHEVGGKAENTFDEVEHKIPMLSLGKSMNYDELKKWFLDMVSKNVKKFTLEPKLDGLATSLEYEKNLNQGATRGDGIIGEDITATALTVPNIPRMIANEEMLEVRGEIVLLKSGLEAINKIKIAKGEKPYQNVRNAASGLLRTKNPIKEMGQYLRFGAYMLARKDGNSTSHSEDMNYLKSQGFTLAMDMVPSLTLDLEKQTIEYALEAIKEFVEHLNEVRDDFNFDIDGVVIKCDLYSDQKRLGSKTNIPNWATAYKFPAMGKMTQIIGYDWLLGAKGNITPRSVLIPVEIGGTIVTKPTLHNIEEITRLDIKVGDYVWVERRGDVIPKITKVFKELRTGNEKDIVIPTTCPECGQQVIVNKAFIRCENLNCSGRQSSRIQNFIVSLEIEEFGPKVIEKLIDARKLNDVADIYSLTVNDIASLERMGQKSAKKIIDNIDKSRNSLLAKIIAGLTIKNVSISTGKDLANKYQTLDAFAQAKSEELFSMDGLGPVTTQYIIDWLENVDNQMLLQKLITIGIGQNHIEEVQMTSAKLNGAKFSFTGKVSVPRTQMEKLITENGGEVFNIKKGLNYLILGEGGKSAKAQKAKELGAEIISEQEFRSMI